MRVTILMTIIRIGVNKMSEGYNGWSNYATWRVNLELLDGMDPRDSFYSRPSERELADYLRDYVNEAVDQYPDGFVKDYCNSFLDDVDWYEIASAMIADHYGDDDEADEDDDL